MSTLRYLVGVIEKRHKIPLADGMVGVVPAFESLESAQIYSKGRSRIFAMELVPPTAPDTSKATKRAARKAKKSPTR